MPLSAAKNRELPPQRYVFATLAYAHRSSIQAIRNSHPQLSHSLPELAIVVFSLMADG